MSKTTSSASAAKKKSTPIELRPASRSGETSLNDQAYEIVKHKVITCAYQPGQYINETLVCNDLGLSRTPVHNAFNRLKIEGLIEMIPRKGIIIKPVSMNEISDVAEARQVNETCCAALAADRATREQIERMKQLLQLSEQAAQDRDVEQLMLLDRDFHSEIAAATQNRILADVSRQLQEKSLRVWFISLNNIEQLRRVQSEHEAICEAIAGRDVEAARTAMEGHISSFLSNISKSI
ncbi:MAG: GntR family transcriptional regulator [Rhizobiaceae bacterium MnEN-MB40S]|nr:MAG: GntR family transcriptional regulator [Rhizobiaceae bacterium MnEN-MB40S]